MNIYHERHSENNLNFREYIGIQNTKYNFHINLQRNKIYMKTTDV